MHLSPKLREVFEKSFQKDLLVPVFGLKEEWRRGVWESVMFKTSLRWIRSVFEVFDISVTIDWNLKRRDKRENENS